MIEMTLVYGEVHTYMFVIRIQTMPLELRAGIKKLNKSSNIVDNGTLKLSHNKYETINISLYGGYTPIPNVEFSWEFNILLYQ